VESATARWPNSEAQVATHKGGYKIAAAANSYTDPKTRFHDRSQAIREEFVESLQQEMMFKLALLEKARA